MLLTVENKLTTSRHQVPGKPREQGVGGRILHVEGTEGAAVTRTVAWPSWKAGPIERDGSHRPHISRLASLAGASRAQLAVLTEAGVTAGLREWVTGVTCLASVRPMAPRLTAAPIVLARSPGASVLHCLPTEGGGVARAPRLEALVDEGGIYSW